MVGKKRVALAHILEQGWGLAGVVETHLAEEDYEGVKSFLGMHGYTAGFSRFQLSSLGRPRRVPRLLSRKGCIFLIHLWSSTSVLWTSVLGFSSAASKFGAARPFF